MTESWRTLSKIGRDLTRGVRAKHWIAASIVVAGLLIAAAIAFDDAHLSDYQIKVIRLLATIGGGIAVVFGGFRYLWERHQELAWQKTTFMVQLFKDFEEDQSIRRAQRLVDYWRSSKVDTRLRAALRPMHLLETDEARDDQYALDRYLDFFDHLYTYIFITETLSPEDASSFSGYVLDILDSEPLSNFAFEWGYEDVLRLAIYYAEHPRIAGRATLTAELMKAVEAKRDKP